jgi:hypothetical protein
VIELPALGGTERELWDTLLDLAERQPDGWTLVGGQMVLLLALEQRRVPPRVTRDLAGALVIKAAAAGSDHGRGAECHLSYLAVLFSLVADPFRLREELGSRNAHRIAAVQALDNDEHEAWRPCRNPSASKPSPRAHSSSQPPEPTR